ncbi:hypothetical protein BH11VER1_BH11VER1_25780 [soil metagenome]
MLFTPCFHRAAALPKTKSFPYLYISDAYLMCICAQVNTYLWNGCSCAVERFLRKKPSIIELSTLCFGISISCILPKNL